jgi:hypothetical protein
VNWHARLLSLSTSRLCGHVHVLLGENRATLIIHKFQPCHHSLSFLTRKLFSTRCFYKIGPAPHLAPIPQTPTTSVQVCCSKSVQYSYSWHYQASAIVQSESRPAVKSFAGFFLLVERYWSSTVPRCQFTAFFYRMFAVAQSGYMCELAPHVIHCRHACAPARKVLLQLGRAGVHSTTAGMSVPTGGVVVQMAGPSTMYSPYWRTVRRFTTIFSLRALPRGAA